MTKKSEQDAIKAAVEREKKRTPAEREARVKAARERKAKATGKAPAKKTATGRGGKGQPPAKKSGSDTDGEPDEAKKPDPAPAPPPAPDVGKDISNGAKSAGIGSAESAIVLIAGGVGFIIFVSVLLGMNTPTFISKAGGLAVTEGFKALKGDY